MSYIYSYTTIASESDAVHITAHIDDDGKYVDPMITFYETGPYGWRWEGSKVLEAWDHSQYLIDELYIDLCKSKEIGGCMGLDESLVSLLSRANTSTNEMVEMFNKALKMGFFNQVECEFLEG